MARRPNYGFEKRQKELKREEKRSEKEERKRLRREGAEAGDAVPQADGDMGEPSDEGRDA